MDKTLDGGRPHIDDNTVLIIKELLRDVSPSSLLILDILSSMDPSIPEDGDTLPVPLPLVELAGVVVPPVDVVREVDESPGAMGNASSLKKSTNVISDL